MNRLFLSIAACTSPVKYRAGLLRAFLFLAVVLIASCGRNETKDAAFYDNVFKQADKQYKTGMPVAAKHYLDSIFAQYTDAPPYYVYMRYRYKSEWAHVEGADSNDVYIDSMLTILETNHLTESHPTEYATALNSRGDRYFDEGDMQKAFEFYFKSRMATQNTKDTCDIANHSYHLGMVSYRQEKYVESIKFFKESLDETTACDDNEYKYYRIEELYNNIGLAYTHLKKYDSAHMYYNYALDFTERDRKRLNLNFVDRFAVKATGVILGNIAKIYIAQGKTDTAEQLLLKSIQLNGRSGYEVNDAMSASMQLAELYYSQGKLPQTQVALMQVKSGLDTLHNNNVKLRWLRLTYLYHKAKNEPVVALQVIERYLDLKDSIDITNKKLKQTDFGQLLKTQDVQYQMKLLKKNSELNRLYLAGAICLSLLTIGLIIFVYRSYYRSKKNVQLLTLLNRRVNEQKGQLENTMVRLEQMNNDKDRILHVVAHDLRNPINAIVSIINLMEGDVQDEEHKEYLKMMSGASDNSLLLIGEILEFSGNKVQQPVGEKEVSDINELVKQAAGILQFKADEKQQKIVLALFDEPVKVLAYPGKMARVFSNLIANAIKFSPEHSTIELHVLKNGNKALIEVKDYGIGIPEKYKPVIFQTFTEAKRYGTSGEVSFGLGLSICKQIVEAAGGKIWFDSAEGKGSSFFIELPLT